MKPHRQLADLIRSPWAILEDYRPLIAGVLARIVSGKPLSAGALDEVRASRREWQARHDEAAASRDEADYQRVRGSGTSDGDVAVIPMYGILTQRGGFDMDTSEPLTSMQRIAQTVQLAAADPSIGAIVLDVDSPGGSVYGVAELGDAIYTARKAKPVAAVSNSLMASAAYWASSQAGEVYCAPGGEVGSIGVIAIHANVSEALRQAGVDITLVSAGRFKTETYPYGALGDEARAFLQGSVNQYHDAFVAAVARGRGASQRAVREEMGQGRVFQPAAAIAADMIDGVATLNQVVAKLQGRAQGRGGRASSAPGGGTAKLAEMQRIIKAHERSIELEFLAANSEEERRELEQIYGRHA